MIRKCKLLLLALLIFAVNCYAHNSKKLKKSKGNNQIPISIFCEPQRDVGFYVAAHLNLPGVAICLYDKKYISAMKKMHTEMGIDDARLAKEAPLLSEELTKYWKVHRLVRVPVYFGNFKDTEIAFDLLLGKMKVDSSNKHVWIVLENNLLILYPYLNKFSGKEKVIADKLVNLIEYEYYHFYKNYFEKSSNLFRKEANTFKNAWLKEYEPALRLLNSNNHAIKKVEIILSPALQIHGKSFRVIDGIGRVATLLPKNNEELQRGLINAYHEMCHGISDKIVYKEMKLDRNKMSFKSDEKGSEIHSLIENAANQTMYFGLKYGNPKRLKYFFESSDYGDLTWMIKYNTFESSFKLAKRNISKEEIARLAEEMKSDPVKASKYIYKRGLLVDPKVFDKLTERVSEDNIRK
jgi:hypothetical protein